MEIVTETLTSKQVIFDQLEELFRRKLSKHLQSLLEEEVQDWITYFEERLTSKGTQLVTRNGYAPQRKILSRGGEVEFRRPKVRVNEATPGEEIKFESKVVPLYLRKTQEMSEVVPWLYLKGISSNDFPSYLKTLYGDEAKGLSPSTVMRLKEDWQKEYDQWNQRELTEEIVYIWADAVYFKVRAEQDKHCFLVVMGSNLQGEKVTARPPPSEVLRRNLTVS